MNSIKTAASEIEVHLQDAGLDDDEIESLESCHRLAAAEADGQGDDDARERHAHQAYRHQLNAIQYAEIAVMQSEPLDDEFSGLVG